MVITALVKPMIKSILNYLRWSNIVIILSLNPCGWRLKYEYSKPDSMNPKMHYLMVKLLMFRIEFIIDDGSW